MMDSVTVYLKNLDGGKVLVSKGVVYLEVGTVGSPFEVEVLGLVKSNRTTSNGYIHSTEATHESISCGGLHCTQELGYCIGEYINLKWERIGGWVGGKRREQLSAIVFSLLGWQKQDGVISWRCVWSARIRRRSATTS